MRAGCFGHRSGIGFPQCRPTYSSLSSPTSGSGSAARRLAAAATTDAGRRCARSPARCRRRDGDRRHGDPQRLEQVSGQAAPKTETTKAVQRRPVPQEMRGVHVTPALASTRRSSPNTSQSRAEHPPGGRQGRERRGRLPDAEHGARAEGRSDEAVLLAGQVAGKARAAGVYLIGRIVTFEDDPVPGGRDLAMPR